MSHEWRMITWKYTNEQWMKPIALSLPPLPEFMRLLDARGRCTLCQITPPNHRRSTDRIAGETGAKNSGYE
jgi:hypothetical protein